MWIMALLIVRQKFCCYRVRKVLVVKMVLMADQVLLDPLDPLESRGNLDPRESLDTPDLLGDL